MPDHNPDTGPLEKVKREVALMGAVQSEMKGDVSETRSDVRDIKRILLGNGGRGLTERVALLEQMAGIGRYLITAVVGIGAAIITALLLRGLP